MKKYQSEIIGIYFLFISIFVFTSLIDHGILSKYNIMGPLGYWISNKLMLLFGLGSYILPVIFGILGYNYISDKEHERIIISKLILYLLSMAIWFCAFFGYISDILNFEVWRHFSGLIGISISSTLVEYINLFTPFVFIVALLAINMIYFNFSIGDIFLKIKEKISRINQEEDNIEINPPSFHEEERDNQSEETDTDFDVEFDEDIIPEKSDDNSKGDLGGDGHDSDDIDIQEEVKEEEIDIDAKADRKRKFFNYSLPASNLLNSPIETNIQYSEEQLHKRSQDLMHALETYNVMGKVRRINQGPVITLFEIEPDEGVRVNKFVTLSDDLARAMEASRVRIIAPIPGTRFVGVEVPNESPAIVYLKSIITSDAYISSPSKMTIALGKTTSGKSFSYELDKMPHLLVAGATGSGKSVCINSIIASILYKAKPDEVKFILIDPKKVELSSYNVLKDYHLITTPSIDEYVVTKTENSNAILDSAIREMERRFELFSKVKVRNLDEYNDKRMKDLDLEAIPHIVIIIDEYDMKSIFFKISYSSSVLHFV